MASLFKTSVVAVDNDPVAVEKTLYNATINGLSNHIHAFVSEGWESVVDKDYDLVTANILAAPLQALAPSMYDHMTPHGRIILSGLLKNQKEDVLKAYKEHHFTVVQEYLLGDWVTLVMERSKS